jgi:3',5'-cyclic AMP phosphodiesterase CpdA
VSGPPVVIAHLSDLHVGAHLPSVLPSLVADVEAAGPGLTVVTGDLTMRARRAEFAAARTLLERLPGPLLVVLGNHDVPLLSPARICSPYARYRRQITTDLDPAAVLPGVQALGLASMPRWRWKGGRVSRRQVRLVRERWDEQDRLSVRLLALHHPVSAGGLSGIFGRERLLSAAADAQVDLVLAGHTHVPAARRLELPTGGPPWSVLEVVAGTATSTRVRGGGRSWTLIQVDPDAIRVQEREQVGSGWRDGRVAVHPRGRR